MALPHSRRPQRIRPRRSDLSIWRGDLAAMVMVGRLPPPPPRRRGLGPWRWWGDRRPAWSPHCLALAAPCSACSAAPPAPWKVQVYYKGPRLHSKAIPAGLPAGHAMLAKTSGGTRATFLEPSPTVANQGP